MTKRELRKMSRTELLELLLNERRENEVLREKLKKALTALSDRQIALTEAGSIAEAALRINRVFEAAQAAADQYLENVRRLTEDSQP